MNHYLKRAAGALALGLAMSAIGLSTVQAQSRDRVVVLSMAFSAAIDARPFGDRVFAFMHIRGAVFNESGGGFLHKATTVCRVANDTGMIFGYCEIVDTGGDQVIMLVQRLAEPDRLSGAGGEFIFIGGSGKYANLSGGGTYAIDYQIESDSKIAHGFVILEGRYTIR